MPSVVAESELFRSCEILFGLDLNLSREFLEYLQHAGVKSAYRKKARETHPDLAAGKSEVEKKALAQIFQSVQEAYENLKVYLDARDQGYKIPAERHRQHQGAPKRRRQSANFWRPDHSPPTGRASTAARESRTEAKDFGGRCRTSEGRYADASRTDKFYTGPMPNRKLLLCHFLYYSGVINWRTIVQALVWQRMQRPRLGELGKKLGWLSEKDIRHIMEYRLPFQPFGESAVRLGHLTEQQLTVLVFQQKRLQKKIGRYFVENRIMSQQRLDRYIDKYRLHNAAMKNSGLPSRFSC
jgi:hypothetical protein